MRCGEICACLPSLQRNNSSRKAKQAIRDKEQVTILILDDQVHALQREYLKLS